MITVLLASYNGEAYLRQQLDSILNQTFQELSIVISDDQSFDGTPSIIKEYRERYPQKIRCLVNQTPSGSAQNNFFRLLREAGGGYVMLCDQDDIWLPDKVEVTWKEMKRQEKQWGLDTPILIHGDLSVTDENERILHKSMVKFQKIGVRNNRFSHYLVENNITGSTVMLNPAFAPFLALSPKVCMMHDWWLGLLASCFGTIAYIDRPLLLYRQHGNNQLGAKSGMKQLMERLCNHQGAKEQYGRIFLQAEAFLDCFGDRMSKEHRDVLAHFLMLPERSRIGKIVDILTYKFYKSTLIRTFGQMLSI